MSEEYPLPAHPQAAKLITSLPESVRAVAAKFMILYEREPWSSFADMAWVGISTDGNHGQYGPTVSARSTVHAYAVYERARSLGVPCVVFPCRCPADCGKQHVMPAALYRDPNPQTEEQAQ